MVPPSLPDRKEVAARRRHRRSHIETTAGTHESLIYALMMTEIAIPILMGLFRELDALVLLIMIGTFFVHEATAYWDVAYAETLRDVTPTSSTFTVSSKCFPL